MSRREIVRIITRHPRRYYGWAVFSGIVSWMFCWIAWSRDFIIEHILKEEIPYAGYAPHNAAYNMAIVIPAVNLSIFFGLMCLVCYAAFLKFNPDAPILKKLLPLPGLLPAFYGLLIYVSFMIPAPARPPSVLLTASEFQVDQFYYNGHVVSVYFKDPLMQQIYWALVTSNASPEGEAGALRDYLLQAAVYRFTVADAAGQPVAHFLLEGDPDSDHDEVSYQVSKYVISLSESEPVSTVRVGIRGLLFEHMAPFIQPEGRADIGKHVTLFEGTRLRVKPYEEVKAAVLPHIERITP